MGRVLRVIVLGVVLGLLGTHTAHAVSCYIKPDSGSDTTGTGTLINPWKTFNKAGLTSSGCDEINILGGSYNLNQIITGGSYIVWSGGTWKHGSAGNPLVIQPNPGDTVTINGQDTTYMLYFCSTAGTAENFYIVIRDIAFNNFRGSAFCVGGNTDSDTGGFMAFVNNRFTNFTRQDTGAVTFQQSYNIILKDNYFSNIGDPSSGIGSSNSHHPIYGGHGITRTVADGNTIDGTTGFGLHWWGGGSSLGAVNSILRKNIVVNSRQASSVFAGMVLDKTYVYQNTFYNEAVPYPILDTGMSAAMVDKHLSGTWNNARVLNNIGYGYALQGVVYVADGSTVIPGLVMDYNLWQNLNNVNAAYSWNGSLYTVSSFRAAFPSYEQNTIQANPLFTNAGGRDFSLQAGSPAIDTGTTLTTAVGSGSNSTSLTVSDAGFFHDGYGLIQGDTIQIGPNRVQAPVVVTGVNYSTNTLTLGDGRTWGNGAAVSLAYNGTAPDRGAVESGIVASPVTVFVAPGGSDGVPCTSAGIATPRQTTAGGLACLGNANGSTLNYRAGSYGLIDSDSALILGGTSWSNPTRIQAYNGETVILSAGGTGTNVITLSDVTNNQYIEFTGLTLNASGTSGGYGLRLNGVSNIRFQQGEVRQAEFACLYASGGSGIEFLRNRVRLCTEGINTSGVVGGLVANNVVYGHSDRGIVVRGGSNSVKVYGNSSGNSTNRCIVVVTGSSNSDVRSNIAYGCPEPIVDETGGSSGNIVSGNVTSNPLWVNAALGDMHLQAGSPAIDAGIVLLPELVVDFDGNVRGLQPEAGALQYFSVLPPSMDSTLPTKLWPMFFLVK